MTGSLFTADGVRLSLRCWHPEEPNGTAAVLVHGFAASKNNRRVVATARTLAEAGFHVVTYDARGHGTSDGLCTLGHLEHLDVAAAVERARMNADRVVTVGASMGAIAVLRQAALTAGASTGADAVVTLSSPASWSIPRTPRGVASVVLTRTRAGRRITRARLGVRLATVWSPFEPPAELVERLTVPVAIIHGERDRFIRPAAASTLYAHAREPRLLELVSNMGHAYDAAATPAVVRAAQWALTALRTPVAQPRPLALS